MIADLFEFRLRLSADVCVCAERRLYPAPQPGGVHVVEVVAKLEARSMNVESQRVDRPSFPIHAI